MKVMLVALFVVFSFVGSWSQASAGKEPQTVGSVDLQKYSGKWYEVASIPQSFQKQCVSNTTAEYASTENGLISVVNSCDTKTGERSIAEGRAKVEDTVSNSKLKVTFVKIFNWVFAFGGKYWILDVDANYSYALVGDPTRGYAWILSRTPNISGEQLSQFEKKFSEQGYDTCKILTSVQTGGFTERKPLCQLK
ncbi:lipocalin family protein [soil metagenome]